MAFNFQVSSHLLRRKLKQSNEMNTILKISNPLPKMPKITSSLLRTARMEKYPPSKLKRANLALIKLCRMRRDRA